MDAILDGKAETVCHQQWDYGCTPLSPLTLRTESFRFHEGIEDTDIGRTLPWVVLKVEELETCHVLCTQIHLYVLLVELERPQTAGLMEIFRLIQHAGLLQTVAEHLHIIWIEHTGVLLDLIVVRIGLELSRLMRDDGHGLRMVCSF